MRLTIAYSKIRKQNLVLINNDTHQRETVSDRPIRPPLNFKIKSTLSLLDVSVEFSICDDVRCTLPKKKITTQIFIAQQGIIFPIKKFSKFHSNGSNNYIHWRYRYILA